MKVVCDKAVPFLNNVFEPLGWQVEYLAAAAITAETVREADALIIRTRTECNGALLAGSRVRFIATATIGFDHLDTEYLTSRGIAWSNAPGCNAGAVAQYLASALIRHGRGGTLGVIGVGAVGSRVARVGELLGYRVLLNDPPRAEREGAHAFTALNDLLAAADVVTLHVPGGIATRHLAGAEFFAQLKRGALFINTSRGSVADESALAEWGGDAILDVWANEPEIDRRSLARVLEATPHIAGYSQDGKANATVACVRSLAEFFGVAALRDFEVGTLEPPASPRLALPERDQLRAAILHSYDLAADTQKLRAAPEAFEKLRSEYRFRREFGAFTLAEADAVNSPILRGLGFNVED